MSRTRGANRCRKWERDQPNNRGLAQRGRPPGILLPTLHGHTELGKVSSPNELAEQSTSYCLQHLPLEVLRGSLVPFFSSPGELARVRCAGGAAFSAALAGAAGVVLGVAPGGVPATGRQHWESWYRERWPQFHEHERYRLGSAQDWVRTYCETFFGQREFLLEVFERDRDPGFAMSAVAAHVRWVPPWSARVAAGAFFARFVSVSAALPELIPAHEGRRLRFCPLAVRDCLEPLPREPTLQPSYPYRTLSGMGSLVPGQGVELQWKMQEGSPFGWWYGLLETLAPHPDGQRAVATITFLHFHRSSYWRKVEVTFGDGVMRSCVMGGFNGGVRPCSRDEERKWAGLLPARELSL